MIYYRASYPGFLRMVVRLFDSRELAEQWVQKLGVRKVATVDMFGTLENDTTQPRSEEECNRDLKKGISSGQES